MIGSSIRRSFSTRKARSASSCWSPSSSAAARPGWPAAPSPPPGGRGGMSLRYMLILGAAVRFIHFALFDGTLLSLHYYAGRHRRSACCSASRLPGHPRRPDEHAIWLAQRAHRPAALGAARRRRKSAEDVSIPDDFSPELALESARSPGRRRPGTVASRPIHQGEMRMKKAYYARPCARLCRRPGRHRPGPDQDRRRRADHRPERRLRRADQERRRAGGRRHQRGRRHPRPEDHRRPTATTCPIRSRAFRSPTSSPATA